MIESHKVRLVRCPKCKHILPELPDAAVYVCGGCGAVLQGKKNRKSGADTSSETSNEDKVERVSLKSVNLLENEGENFSNSGDISDAEAKSNASSLNSGKRGSGAENSQSHSRDRADKWVVQTTLDMNTSRDGSDSIKMGKKARELKSHVQNASTLWRSERSSEWRFGEREEVEGFPRKLRTDVGGMRYSYPTYPDEEPSDYGYVEPLVRSTDVGGGRRPYSTYPDKGPSNFGYGERSRDGSSSLNGGDGIKYSGHEQNRLVRQLDELKGQLNRSCYVTGKPQEKVAYGRRMLHDEAYEDSEAWFPASTSGSRNSMPSFAPDKCVLEPPYPRHYADPFSYGNRHENGMHIQGYEDDVFGPRMARQRRDSGQAPGHYQQHPPHTYFPGEGYMEPDSNPHQPYPRNPNFHHPPCSCLHCSTRQQEVPGSIAPNAFFNRRFADIPNDPMLYHRENPVAFGPRVYNPRTGNHPLRTSLGSHSHTRIPSDLNSQNSDFAHPFPLREAPNGRRYCRPLAGGAPFITCCNCCELLRLPKKVLLVKKNQHKIRCGACSTIIFLAVSLHKIVASIHDETEKTSKEVNDVNNQPVDAHTSDSHGQVNNHRSENFSSDDYDKAAYDFQSMDAEGGLVLIDQCLNSSKPEAVQELHSSHNIPENEGSQEGLVVRREVDGILERPKKSVLSRPPPGSPLQAHFDYSSNNFELNCHENGNRSIRSDNDKEISSKAVSRQSSIKDAAGATEMEVSFNEFSNTGVSQESGDASREHDDLRINKRGERFLAGIIKEDFRNSSTPSQTTEEVRGIVMVNGHLIPDHLVNKAEKLAGAIQSGEYWYDFYAGFWGVMGGRCLGIIPPFIEEFKYPMPENCAAGNTGVYVNGRELNQKDLDLLASRGLPTISDRDYTIDISGRVQDRDTGEELESLGKLAPTVEKMKRGFGMKIPRSAA